MLPCFAVTISGNNQTQLMRKMKAPKKADDGIIEAAMLISSFVTN